MLTNNFSNCSGNNYLQGRKTAMSQFEKARNIFAIKNQSTEDQ